jgi:minor extracellular serine protease Vpr
VGLFAVAAALCASAVPAGASLLPVRRTFGETTLPRVRAGTLHIPAAHRADRIRVIVGLSLPPLAAAYGRTFAGAVEHSRLDVASTASRAYLRRVVSAQQRAVADLRRAIPQARVQERFQVVLDGITVDLPVAKLAALTRLPFAQKVYPSLAYTLDTNRSPGVIGADELHAATGAKGDGIKIGIVDDGVDPTNPFLSPTGFSYPAGFPRGDLRFTSPKVIVARAFPGPNSGPPGRLAVDRRASFHGTHVAGIAAGDAGTCSPGGADHPPTCGLSGVASRAFLGNYRVFTVPTPLGHVANTPEIVDAFESAVRDGMQVINFSGGGPETEPSNDAMIDTVRNTAAAGVVPVIAAGNDRDQFGLGTVGSPGTAPDAITVAAVSNTHVFTPTMSITSPGAPSTVQGIPINSAGGDLFPDAFATTPRPLVDIGVLTTTGGAPVDRRLCGPDNDPNNDADTPLAAGALSGDVALVSRGHCTFVSKAIRAARAGAVGIVIVDNRSGEAEPIPVRLPIPGGKIADLDGANLRAYLDARGGIAPATIGHAIQQVETGRSGIITDFSSAGLTDFQDMLKPDVAAPGGQILSSTLPEFTGGSPFAVFDGTSMATPQVTGSAALLLQLHPGWTPEQVKSALVSTAGPAWIDTARSQEAPVTLEGGGLINVFRANDPHVFTEPSTLSFRDLDVTDSAQNKALLVRVIDAGDGSGAWTVSLQPQHTTPGAALSVPGVLDVAPGGEADLVAIARASHGAGQGEDYGHIVLSQGDVTRRIPYAFVVSNPALAALDATKLKAFNTGQTVNGPNLVSTYCCPSEPFGPPPDYVGAPMDESGSEQLFVTTVQKPLVNMGASVFAATNGALIDPWFLGSKDENDVQGYAGTPVNQNELMFDFALDTGAAGTVFPRQQQFYVAVDSGSDPFTHQPLPGSYILRFWENDLKPPTVKLLTTRVTAGRPTIVARVLDDKSGVDPLSLVIAYRHVLVGASLYDPFSGLAVFGLPRQAARIPKGKTRAIIEASDFQEGKNIESISNNLLPNTRFKNVSINGVSGPAVSWLTPQQNQCVTRHGTAGLTVEATSTAPIVAVRFSVDGRQIADDRRGGAGLFSVPWHVGGAKVGRHLLTALATDKHGKRLSAKRAVRVCS